MQGGHRISGSYLGGHMGSGNFAAWYVVVYGVSGAIMGNLYEIDVGRGAGRVGGHREVVAHVTS